MRRPIDRFALETRVQALPAKSQNSSAIAAFSVLATSTRRRVAVAVVTGTCVVASSCGSSADSDFAKARIATDAVSPETSLEVAYSVLEVGGDTNINVLVPSDAISEPTKVEIVGNAPEPALPEMTRLTPSIRIDGAAAAASPFLLEFSHVSVLPEMTPYVRHTAVSGLQRFSRAELVGDKITVPAVEFSLFDIYLAPTGIETDAYVKFMAKFDIECDGQNLKPMNVVTKGGAQGLLSICAFPSPQTGRTTVLIRNKTPTDVVMTLPHVNLLSTKIPGAGEFMGLVVGLAYGVFDWALLPAGEVAVFDIDADMSSLGENEFIAAVESRVDFETFAWTINVIIEYAGRGAFGRADSALRRALENVPDELGEILEATAGRSRAAPVAARLRHIADALDDMGDSLEHAEEGALFEALAEAFSRGADCFERLHREGVDVLAVMGCASDLVGHYLHAAYVDALEQGPIKAAWNFANDAAGGVLDLGKDTLALGTSILLNPPAGDGTRALQWGLAPTLVDVSGAYVPTSARVPRGAWSAHQYSLTGVARNSCPFEPGNYTGQSLPSLDDADPCDSFGRKQAARERFALAMLLETPPRKFVCRWWDRDGDVVERDGWLYGSRDVPELGGAYRPQWERYAGEVRVDDKDVDIYTDEERTIARSRVDDVRDWEACLTDDGYVRSLLAPGEQLGRPAAVPDDGAVSLAEIVDPRTLLPTPPDSWVKTNVFGDVYDYPVPGSTFPWGVDGAFLGEDARAGDGYLSEHCEDRGGIPLDQRHLRLSVSRFASATAAADYGATATLYGPYGTLVVEQEYHEAASADRLFRLGEPSTSLYEVVVVKVVAQYVLFAFVGVADNSCTEPASRQALSDQLADMLDGMSAQFEEFVPR